MKKGSAAAALVSTLLLAGRPLSFASSTEALPAARTLSSPVLDFAPQVPSLWDISPFWRAYEKPLDEIGFDARNVGGALQQGDDRNSALATFDTGIFSSSFDDRQFDFGNKILRASGAMLSPAFTSDQKLQYLRVLAESQVTIPISLESNARLKAGLGAATVFTSQQWNCAGSGCVYSTAAGMLGRVSSDGGTEPTWEVSADLTYRRLMVGLMAMGLPNIQGTSMPSPVYWTTGGGYIGLTF